MTDVKIGRCINAAKVKKGYGIAPSVDKVVRINDFIVNKYSLYNYFMFINSYIIYTL